MTTNRKGKYVVKRKTSTKKFRASLKRLGEWLKKYRTVPIMLLMKNLKVKLIGYYRYYGINDNIDRLDSFLYSTRQLLFKWLNRRSQRRSYNWKSFNEMLKHYRLPTPKVYVNIYELNNKSSYIL